MLELVWFFVDWEIYNLSNWTSWYSHLCVKTILNQCIKEGVLIWVIDQAQVHLTSQSEVVVIWCDAKRHQGALSTSSNAGLGAIVAPGRWVTIQDSCRVEWVMWWER